MKKLISILSSFVLVLSGPIALVSCFPNEIEVYYSSMSYEYLTPKQTEQQIPVIKKRIESFENRYMKSNITDNLYLGLTKSEFENIEVDDELNGRQKELLIDSLSANLRIYKIIDSNSRFNSELFDTRWVEIDETNNRFKVDILFNENQFVIMSGEFFEEDGDAISEINEVTFSQIADLAKEDNKIITSSIGAFWGVDFIGDKYSKTEQENLWLEGGKYENYEFQPKQTMTWKGEQKMNIDQLKHTMTDYISSRLRMSGVIQSNLEIKYEQLDFNINDFIGASTEFKCKTDAPGCENKYNLTNVKNFDDEYYYFSEDSDFGATTLIQINIPTIWYKGNPDVTIQQGGSIFQSHLEYRW
ncbi:hypothetical protein [Spiroplasma endosymbiont of Othius punctulatus]|uniref:hypothetical protein n=1 Tax=Spiroplasma endosymbiont of Othius punctulatus TaxID=3066289 RepID=UPI0030D6209B